MSPISLITNSPEISFFPQTKKWRERGCVGTITVHITKFNFPHYSEKAPAVILYLHYRSHKYHLKCTHFAQWLDSIVEVKQRYSFSFFFSIMDTEQSWSCLFQDFNALFTSRMLIKADCSFTNDSKHPEHFSNYLY